MTRKKILEIIPTLDRSGAEKQLALLASGLPKEEFEVRVAVLTRDGPMGETLRQNEIPYTVIGKTSKLSFGAFARLKKEIRAFKPDLVHTWIFAANAYGRKAAIDLKVPAIVCGERCVDPWKKPWHFFIDRYLAKKTDCIAVNSGGIKDFYIERGLPAEKFTVIPNAALPAKRSQITKKDICDQLHLPYQGDKLPYIIGMVARLWGQKRIKEAVWAAEELKFVETDFHLLIFGDGPLREDLLRYRDKIGISDRVHFLGHRNDIWNYIPHFDLLWCTSAYEGQSNSIIEAMAAGVPVIASDIPGNRELVVPNETGILIPEYNGSVVRRRTAFCRESYRLLTPENDALRQTLGENAKRRIETEFSYKKMIERYQTLYRNLIAQKKGS